MFKTRRSNRLARRAGKQGARPATVQYAVEKLTTGQHQQQKHLFKCRKSSIISTFNARTLRSECQLNECINAAMETKQDVVCIQEHRQYHPDDLLRYNYVGSGWLFVTASAWKNGMNASMGGVGMLISPKAQKSLNCVEKISDRIIIASFDGNPSSSLICCYSPTNSSDEENVNSFYTELSSLIRMVPAHNIKLIAGDFNAKIGQDKGFKHAFHTTTNRNGLLLLELMTEHKLVCLNTKFQKKNGKKWSFEYPNGIKAQIDLILMNKKWINGATNCEVYNTFDCVGSDHRIVAANIRLSLRANKVKRSKAPRYDWSFLRRDKDLSDKFSLELKNRYSVLQFDNPDADNNNLYLNFESAFRDAAKECIPLKPIVKRKFPWENEAIEEKRNQLKSLSSQKTALPTSKDIMLIKKAKQGLRLTYEKEQAKFLQSKIDEIKSAADNKQSALAWKVVNEISGRKKSHRAKIKAIDQDDRLSKWKDHFHKLLGNPPNILDQPTEQISNQELNIKTEDFTMDELEVVIKKLTNNKACGLDDIPGEVWKTGSFNDELLQFCNGVYNGRPIDRWTVGCILPFPKKGDLSKTDNYRGITLAAISAKIYNSLLLHRIRPHLEKVLRKNQNGFRPNRSTVGQILTVRRILEGVKSKNLEAVLLFIDFSKAFDSIHREKLSSILLAYGVPQVIVDAIAMLYKNSKAIVRSPDGDTDLFQIEAGVLQGDTLAPYLFIICLDYALRISADKNNDLGITLTKRKSSRHPATHMTDIDYADDLALLADDIYKAENLLHHIEKATSQIGLYINVKKTEYVSINQSGKIQALNGSDIKEVQDFVYLGSHIQSTEKDIDIRIAKGWAALSKLSSIWKSNLPDDLKRDLFRSVVETVLLYGSTAWTLTKKLEKKLDGTYTRMLRAVLNIHWKKHPTIQQLYGKLPRISYILRERRLRLAGHSWRNKNELISDVLLWTPTHGKCKQGRPVRTYIDQLVDDAGYCIEDLPSLMEPDGESFTKV